MAVPNSPVGAGAIVFLNNSTAGNATIRNDNPGGNISFSNNSTAGNATILHSYTGGSISFSNNSTAGNATIYFNDFAHVSFPDSSTAGNATIGGLEFLDFGGSSTGGTSHIYFQYNLPGYPGRLEISSHDAPGMTVGSIAGGGIVLLGANNLTVGSDNLSTIFYGHELRWQAAR